MYNNGTYNDQAFGYSTPPTTATQDDIAFEGFGLQNSKIVTSNIDFDDLGRVDLDKFDYSLSDGGGVLSKFFRGRTITLKMTLRADTAQGLTDAIDDMKRNLRYTEGNLDIRVTGTIRRIRATLTSLVFDRQHYNLTFINVVAKFEAVEAFFNELVKQSWTIPDGDNDFFAEFTHEGSADVDPIFYLIYGPTTTGTAVSITKDGLSISATTAITSGDIIVVNCEEKTVEKNGVALDYTGVFPILSPGSNSLQFVTTGTAAITLTAVASKNYL